jgi:hypothetical protein
LPGREEDLEVDAARVGKGAKERPAGARRSLGPDGEFLVEDLDGVPVPVEQQDVPRLVQDHRSRGLDPVRRGEPVGCGQQAPVELRQFVGRAVGDA